MKEGRSFTIQLAEKRIHIRLLYAMIKEYCKEYIIPDIYANLKEVISCENYAKKISPFL